MKQKYSLAHEMKKELTEVSQEPAMKAVDLLINAASILDNTKYSNEIYSLLNKIAQVSNDEDILNLDIKDDIIIDDSEENFEDEE